jgi:multicomponent Na+:H+ antiporter subunit B
MIEVLMLFLLILSVITAVGVVRTRNLFASVMLMGIFSLLLAAVFLLLDAPDVALTEAAVGAGISTVLLLSALALTVEEEQRVEKRSFLAIAVVLVTASVVFYATFDKPTLGDPLAPVHQHVAAEYFPMTRDQVDIPNVVTAVLASFRGYDTIGEVIVVLTAAIGVLFLLGSGPSPGAASETRESFVPGGLKHHQPLRIVGKIAIPFIILFALYVQFHGEYSPGGGFQAGALLAAGIILFGLLEGRPAAASVIPPSVLRTLAASGALIYGGVGVATMLMGGNFLEYKVLGDDPIKAQQTGILIIEIGVGVTVSGVLIAIYHAFASRGRRS